MERIRQGTPEYEIKQASRQREEEAFGEGNVKGDERGKERGKRLKEIGRRRKGRKGDAKGINIR